MSKFAMLVLLTFTVVIPVLAAVPGPFSDHVAAAPASAAETPVSRVHLPLVSYVPRCDNPPCLLWPPDGATVDT